MSEAEGSATGEAPRAGIWFPNGATSRVVLIGASTFASKDLPDIPAVRKNLEDLKAAFLHPRYGLFADTRPEHCTVLGLDGKEALDQRAIGGALAKARAAADDLLLVYYTGHGLVGDDSKLHLALEHTDPEQTGFTALPLSVLQRELAGGRAAARVLILDCCFSGRAVDAMGANHPLVSAPPPARGVYVLTSTSANSLSMARKGHRNSIFTGALLQALAQPEPLSLGDVYQFVRHTQRVLEVAEPQTGGIGDAHRVALVRGPVPAGPSPVPPRWWRVPRRWLASRWLRGGVLVALTSAGVFVYATLDTGTAEPEPEPKPTPSATRPTRPPEARQPRPTEVAPYATRKLTVELYKTRRTPEGTVIGVNGMVGNINRDGTKDAFGGGQGQIGGSAAVRGDDSEGGSVSGLVDFFVETSARDCKAHGVAIGESTVLAAPSGGWTRVLVVGVAPGASEKDEMSATFRVSQGRGPVPEGDKTCA
ncbi:caspase family protein [Streptomyces buecherae]|uniref:caspase family protein n=1 Tax=Streptomyces buecherae TaxID=2763006 RepID=UPI0033DF999A